MPNANQRQDDGHQTDAIRFLLFFSQIARTAPNIKRFKWCQIVPVLI